jgi:hypothetical protein
MSTGAIIGGVVVVVCCSSSVAAMMMGGDDDKGSGTGGSGGSSGTGGSGGSSGTGGSGGSSGPVPPPPPSYVEVFGVDYPGNDIKHLPNTTLEKCKAECDANPSCTLITTNNNGNLCWLKSGAKNMTPHGDRKNYFKPNGPWDVNDKFNLVRAGALCTGGASYSSVAWALLKSGEPKKFAEWNSEGDKLYKTYVERGLAECDKDANCKYVNVWRDAGYRKYTGSNCPDQRRDDWTSAFKKLS